MTNLLKIKVTACSLYKLDLLAELARESYVAVEYGIESCYDATLARINRGHDFETARRAVCMTEERGIDVGAHFILGLPGETEGMMLDSVRAVASLRPTMVKLHLLHVLRDTALARIYCDGGYTPMEKDGYVRTVVRALELLPPETVIARLTGDGAADDLLAPMWSRRKREVLNDIDTLLYRENTYQGRFFGYDAAEEKSSCKIREMY